jgi:hypothetical protein
LKQLSCVPPVHTNKRDSAIDRVTEARPYEPGALTTLPPN